MQIEEKCRIVNSLITKVYGLHNSVKVNNYLKDICNWQQLLIIELIDELEQIKTTIQQKR